MKKRHTIYAWSAGLLAAVLVLNVFGDWVSLPGLYRKVADQVKPHIAQGLSQYGPTGGTLVTGTNLPIPSNAASGNVGGWQGTLASDNFSWNVSSTASGVNQQVFLDGSSLNNANKFIIVMETGSNNTTLQRFYQICDWSSSTGVQNAADAQCTTGGWRTLNIRQAAVSTAADTSYTWHLYDGYWNATPTTTSNTAISTPLSNFIRGSDGRILLRAYSATNCTTCTHAMDYVSVKSVVDPIYGPSSVVTSTASTVTGTYRNAQNALFTAQSASDNQYLQVAGTASVTADFYMSFKNVRTAPGANAIVMRAEYSCTTTGITHKPKIWNFNSSSWEDLTATNIACATGDATSAFAKGNVTLTDYISNGEIRIGWYGSGNSTVGIRIDMIYVMVGSVNSDSSQCEISFGTGTATACTNTRDLDTTLASPSTWQQTAETESANFGHDFYPKDNDVDAATDFDTSSNLWIPGANASNTRVTALVFATNFRSNSASTTMQAQFKDSPGTNGTAQGGWTNFGTSNSAATYSYQDSVTNGYFTNRPDDYVDADDGTVNVRLSTTISSATGAVTRDIDFVFVATQWAETSPARATLNARYAATAGTLVTGTNLPRVNNAASGNVGSWRGVFVSDDWKWNVSSTASGFDQQVAFDDVQQNNANQIIVTIEAGASNTTLQRFYQICDWSSSTGVQNAADAQCTGGGWRTMNMREAAITTAADRLYIWHLYDGYWNATPTTTSNTSVSTPISNFLRTSDGRVLIRGYSATNCTTCTHAFDVARIDVVIDPIYGPSGVVTSTASTVTGTYRNTENALFSNQSASDNQYLQVAGTASVTADFYMSFKNVRTYTGANAILMRAEYSCTTTGITHKPKIWNFNSSSWEDLTATNIACATGDATSAFAKGNVTLTDYISNGEIRIGWYGSGNSTVGIRIDMIYVMVGSVNSDSSQCEISFGTGTATGCTATRDLDTTLASPNTWQQTTEAESATFGHAYYAQDNDLDANIDHDASSNVWLPMAAPTGSDVIFRLFATNFRSNASTITMAAQFKDLTGLNTSVSGGWTLFGSTNNATTYTYQDTVTNNYFVQNPEDYVDTYNGRVNVRLRTTVSTAASAITRDVDFVFASIQWVESPSASASISLTLGSPTLAFGAFTPGSPLMGTSTAVVTMTNGSSGYTLQVDHAGTTSTLMHSDGTTSLPDYTDWNSAGSGNATATPGSVFSFRVSTSTGNYNSTWWGSGTALFAGMPMNPDIVMNCTTCNSGNTTTSLSFRLDAPATQKAGNYSGTTTFTAVTNP